jgi:putative DNA primase/helicase
MKEVQRQRDSLDQKKHAGACKVAIADWKAAEPADARHKYLKRKDVGAHSLKEKGGKLLVPMRDADEKLWSILSIDSDGEKRYQTVLKPFTMSAGCGEVGN